MFTSMKRVLTTLGVAGAAANAGRACQQRRDVDAALELQLRRFAPPAVTAERAA